MTGHDDEPIVIDLDSSADDVILVFWDWADSPQDLRLVFTPDVLLAIDTEERSGYLLDEVYWVTVWIRRGGTAFLRLLEERALREPWKVLPPGSEPGGPGMLAGAIKSGRQPTHRLRP